MVLNMKMAHKLIVAVAAVSLTLLFAGNIIFVSYFSKYIAREESEQTNKSMSSAVHYLNELKQKYQATSVDWAHWDETFDFINSGNPDYIKLNLNEKDFYNLNLSFMVFYDSNNQIVDKRYYDFETKRFTQAPSGLITDIGEIAKTSGAKDSSATIISSNGGLYVVSCAKTTDSLLKEKANGKLVIGKLIDGSMIDNLERIANGKIELFTLGHADKKIADKLLKNPAPGTAGYIKDIKKDSISVYSMVTAGEQMKSPIVLRMTMSRDFYTAEMNRLLLLTGVYSVIILVAALVSLLFIYHLAIMPIVKMTQEVKKIDPEKEPLDRMEVYGKDELSVLSNAINGLLITIESGQNNKKKIQTRLMEAQAIANMGNWQFNLKTRRIWASAQAFKIYGIRQASSHLSVEAVEQAVCKDDRKRVHQAMKMLIKQNEEYNLDYKIIRVQDGCERIVHSMAKVEYDQDQKPIKVMGTIQDITEQRQIEQRLRESERSKSVLLSNMPGMAYRCSYDRDWTMQFVSEGCFELTGYKPESLLHNKEVTYNELISPQYREYLWQKWAQVLAMKIVFREEYTIITASGEQRWVFEQGRGIYDENGNVEALEGLIIDITNRKEDEDEIKYLSYHDVLTGLYNRRFFDKETERLDNESQLPISIIIGDINGLKLINDVLGHAEGDKLIFETAKILQSCCRDNDILARTGGDEFTILLPKTDNKTADEVLKKIQEACELHNSKTSNEAYYINISLGYATKEDVGESITSVSKAADEYMYKRKLLEHKSSRSAILSSIKTTMFERSQETEEHGERLTALSKAVGKKLNLSQVELDELELLATLHDIGKVGIGDQILNKKGKLTDDEWKVMKKHPEIGYRIAMASPELMSIADYILYHHEHWDGTGYPQGLKGKEIPLLSRIIAVVDAYDAKTQDRPYEEAMSKEIAVAEIMKNAGTQFDPEIVKIFVETVSKL